MFSRCLYFRSTFSSSAIVEFLILTTLGSVQWILLDAERLHPYAYNYTINHPVICNSSQDIQLLIMVHTACDNFDSRLAVRHTWGSLVKRRDVQLFFLLGSPNEEGLQQQILEEDRTFGDLLQENFLDTYYNLTLKTMMMVKWVTTYCPKAHYVLKIDNDCFMNTDALLTFLRQDLREVAIYGQVWRNVRPFRDKENKWYMPYDIYPKRTYPDFAAGPSYLLTRKAVGLLYATTLTIAPIHLEDVYLNGICAEKANIPRIHNSGFYVQSKAITSVDTLKTAVLTSHEFPSHQLRLLWWLLHDKRGVELDIVLVSRGESALEVPN